MRIFTKFIFAGLIMLLHLTASAQSYNVTFKVDMSQYTGLGATDTVYVNGTWNSWCGKCNPLVKQGTTNVWEGTFSIPSGAQEFKYTINGWSGQENLSSGTPCTITTGSFTNRAITVNANTVLPLVCWQSCSACAGLQAIDLPVNFDSTNVDYTMTDFGGNASTVVADPTSSTNKVAKITKSNTAELWAGTTVGSASGFATAIPITVNTTKMTMRVYSPDSGILVKLKIEDATDGTKSVETDMRTTVANAWETLEFNFVNNSSGTAAINYTYTYKKASVFFNFGVTGATAGTKVYYFDDLKMAPAAPPVLLQVKLPITYDAANVDYTMADFGGNTSSVAVDPVNASNKAGKFVKSNTAELWAGTTLSTTSGLALPIPFAAGYTKMRMKVFSPDSGILVKLKAEVVGDPTKSVETDTRTTVANAWQTLEFDFANQSSGTQAINFSYSYKMLSAFFNFGVTGATAGAKTYYADDIEFVGPTVPSKVDITFSVDMKNVPMAAGDTVTLNGTFNNWCGACIKLKNVPGTKVWYTTVPLDTSKEIEYKFTIGNWAQQETLKSGASCTKTTGSFVNRVYNTTKTNDSLPLVCWESCAACATAAPVKTNLTFRVDMTNYTLNAGDTVTLNGTFNNWCGACNKMSRVGTTNIWQTTLLLDKDSSYDYKYVIGNWSAQETLKDTMPCVTTKSGFTNRTNVVNNLNDTLPVVCWESCGPCKTTGMAESMLSTLRMYPNPATQELFLNFGNNMPQSATVTIYTLLGKQVLSTESKGTSLIQLNTDTMLPGVYLVQVSAGDAVKTFKLIKE